MFRTTWYALIALACHVVSLHAQTISQEYDKFQDATVIKLDWIDGDPFKLTAFAQCKGDALCSPETATLMFSAQNDTWQYLRSHNLILIINSDSRVDLGETTRESSMGRGYVLEFLIKEIPFEVLRQIAQAESVEYQLGTTETELNDRQLKGIANLVATLEPSVHPGTGN